MAKINVTQGTAGAYGAGELQLENKVQMTATLTPVTDNLNTASPLKLSTNLVQTTSTLKITTADNPYIDAEDNSGNNRFTVGRDPASQQVNVDFASNPSGSTTAVGAIRTYRDGTNLSEAMTFIEDGSVGIGTTAPVGLLDLYKAAAATRLAIRGDAGQNRLISYRTGALQRFGLYVNNTAESGSNAGSDFAIRAYNDAGTLLSTPLFIERSTAKVGIGTTTPSCKLEIDDAGSGGVPIFRVLRNGGADGGASFSFGSQTLTINSLVSDFIFAVVSSEKMRLTTDNYLRMASGTGGIQFNGDTAAANALDDYEEGTWTPVLANDGPGVFTLTTQYGKYTKIGNVVQINGYVAWSSNTSVGGQAILSGLPFNFNNSTTPIANQIAIHEQNGGVAQGVHFRNDNTTSVALGYSYNFDGTATNALSFGLAGYIGINGTYFV